MPGRLTGTARHLFEPERKAYYATMEEGFYEVDLVTLEVRELFADNQGDAGGRRPEAGRLASLPGYHGKGLYSGQGVLVYSNNGENSALAMARPDIPSGCLAEWDGRSESWRVVRRAQFTEVTGPGGLRGNEHPETDPIWALGWDHLSVLLMVRDGGEWSSYRLPKGTHTYDGAHGWNTEWPRIREVGLDQGLLMTMHGLFWSLPGDFRRGRASGLRPLSSYLKVVGDFCRWGDRLVMGCDVTARSEFLNTRRAKGEIVGPGESHSNLWFTEPERIRGLGPVGGHGAVWLHAEVGAGQASDPFLFGGFDVRTVGVAHGGDRLVRFRFEVDPLGDGGWVSAGGIAVPPGKLSWHRFPAELKGEWVRLVAEEACEGVVAQFHYLGGADSGVGRDDKFRGVGVGDRGEYSAGLLRVRGEGLRTVAYAAARLDGGVEVGRGFYELDGELRLRRVDDAAALGWMRERVAVPEGVLEEDKASVIYTDDEGNRWRLPRGGMGLAGSSAFGPMRADREVVTERDLFQARGIFYELPARNAGGFSRVRPICTHGKQVQDYCSYRGLLVMSGVDLEGGEENPHVIRSDDGLAALWVGEVDDLWSWGKAVGDGGPWWGTGVKAGQPSDPYLMRGFDRKTLRVASESEGMVCVVVEVDVTGGGDWYPYSQFEVSRGSPVSHLFPEGFQAYWMRLVSSGDAVLSAQLEYR
jgi:hypothetical protein